VTALILVAATRQLLAELLDPENADQLPRIAAGLDRSADAILLGVDLVAPQPNPGTPGIDPTIAAITLAHLTEQVGLIVAAAPHRDHPYNLARRLATIDHASHGRVGLLIADHDASAPAGSPWTTTAPAEAAEDAVVAIRDLLRSFPVDAVVGDKTSGVFAESHRIVAIDHQGAFDITGPLQVPTGPQVWPPVLAWATGASADLVLSADDVRWPTHLDDLDQLLSRLPAVTPIRTTLRDRFGLGAANPPTHGRPVYPDPADKVSA
jgi:alkanesulfonate monooxygenase SsuD/methylene tetrahydromethanopterin reductase-like flavin-dependent oxidoreductase (luciferase family)